jgi:hypothetical protein
MNAYWVETKVIQVVDDWVPYQEWSVPIYEDAIEAEIVIAETPGQARSTFIDAKSHGTWRIELEWTDIKTVRLLAKDVDYPRGLHEFPYNDLEYPERSDPLWSIVVDRIWLDYCPERNDDTDIPWGKYPEWD